MANRNEDERRIREIFSTARHADRGSIPDFRSMHRTARERVRRSTAGRAARFALMTGTATVAVAAAVMWIAVKNPAATVPESPQPQATRETETTLPSSPGEPQQPELPDRPAPAPGIGGLQGHVSDSQGAPMPGVTVTLSNAEGLVRTTSILADANGEFAFPVLRSGSGYALNVSFPGYAPVRQEGLTVIGDGKLEVPVRLTPEIVERVQIAATHDAVALQDAQPCARFAEQFVSDLPEPGRFYQNIITTAPGVGEAESGNASSRVVRVRHYKTVVGGVSNVDPLTGEPELGPGFDTEGYDPIRENEFRAVLDSPLSTFSVDVDSASYANVRRFLNDGRLPPQDAVRVEELINYFNYEYAPPGGEDPFSVHVEIADCPWNPVHRLARIGLKGRQATRGDFAGSNLVFLIDVSGSMAPPNKLPLLKSALSMLVDQLDGRDQVAIVVYAGAAGLVLPSTSGAGKGEIRDALNRLDAGGSTNGGQGIQLAYRIARENFIPGGINRVILATDGDFNVGVTNGTELLKMIGEDAQAGIFLTTLGFGTGNYKDDKLERLADEGNGNYAYIDSLREARKVLVEQVGGTLVTIAKDVKIQIEFNPQRIAGYRLIGYENRLLRAEEFNDDRKDAGEIGAGHTVTALYELVPAGQAVPAASVDPLKYQSRAVVPDDAASDEAFTLKLRYKQPDADTSKLLSFPVVDEGYALASASPDFKFAGAVACFGMLLRASPHVGIEDIDEVNRLAVAGAGPDENGYRAEFRHLVDVARPLLEQRDAD